jgi:hypothetical protein
MVLLAAATALPVLGDLLRYTAASHFAVCLAHRQCHFQSEAGRPPEGNAMAAKVERHIGRPMCNVPSRTVICPISARRGHDWPIPSREPHKSYFLP